MVQPSRWRAALAASVSAALLAASAPASAQAPAERTYSLGASAGVLFPGTLTIEDFDFDTGAGFQGRIAADFFLGNRLSMGPYLQYASTSATVFGTDYDVTMLGIGGTIMGHFGNVSGGHFRAGIALGYQMSDIDAPGGEDVTGFGVGPILEYAHPVGGASIFGHLSFITQPSGGNTNVDVTWGPIFTLAIGAEFGR